MYIVRYADDYVAGFELRSDAQRFLRALKERFSRFGLELHPEKTRLIEFGRFAEGDRRARGERRPETFNFLGFTHYCRRTRKGRFGLGRKPEARRMSRTLKRMGAVLRMRMHDDVLTTGRWLADAARVAWLLRGPDQLRTPEVLRKAAATDVAKHPARAIPEGPFQLGETQRPVCETVAQAAHRPPMAAHPICRQSPKVGAVCVSAHVRICAGGAGQPASLPQKSKRSHEGGAVSAPFRPVKLGRSVTSPPKRSASRSRAVPRAIERLVWQRDDRRCAPEEAGE